MLELILVILVAFLMAFVGYTITIFVALIIEGYDNHKKRIKNRGKHKRKKIEVRNVS